MRLVTLLTLALVSFYNTAQVTSTELDLFDEERNRPVKIRVWYQQGDDCPNKLCIATVKQSSTPVALISHGAFGSPREMNWLGFGLAQQGWLAIGVAHYGESWVYGRDSVDYSSLAKKWLRAQDVSFVLDQLLSSTPLTNGEIDTDKVTVLGHSLGGYSALSLVGADHNMNAMFDYCKQAMATDRGCQYGKGQAGKQQKSKALPDVDVLDKRIKAVVSMDPALGPSVSKGALTNIDLPTLIIGSVQNDFLNYDAHANYYAKAIKGAKLVALEQGEGHFVYLDKCSHPHKAMGVSLCQDRKGIDREKVHLALMSEISDFINKL